MRHQYTRAALEQLLKEHPVWIEGVGLRQLQWGGWEIATHIHNGRLCLKHEADSRGKKTAPEGAVKDLFCWFRRALERPAEVTHGGGFSLSAHSECDCPKAGSNLVG